MRLHSLLAVRPTVVWAFVRFIATCTLIAHKIATIWCCLQASSLGKRHEGISPPDQVMKSFEFIVEKMLFNTGSDVNIVSSLL